MEIQEAVSKAQAHLQNALDLAKRPIGKEDLLYMWDNQITAIDEFLADSEVLKDSLLERARESLRKVKKDLTDAVLGFEAQLEGAQIDGDEPSQEEWVTSYTEMASDMLQLAKEALDEKVKDVQELIKWEEPLAVINGYLADSEPFQEMNHDLKKARSLVRVARRDIKNHITELVQNWRMNQDEDEGDD